MGVKRTTGQHPGGLVIIPQDMDVTDFCSVQHPADDPNAEFITTHFDFNSMHDILVKLDCLGHDDPTMMHRLEELTGVNFRKIPLDDKDVMSLFSSPKALGIEPKDIAGCKTGTFGVPEFGTAFVRQMLEDTHPSTMQELIRISGLWKRREALTIVMSMLFLVSFMYLEMRFSFAMDDSGMRAMLFEMITRQKQVLDLLVQAYPPIRWFTVAVTMGGMASLYSMLAFVALNIALLAAVVLVFGNAYQRLAVRQSVGRDPNCPS